VITFEDLCKNVCQINAGRSFCITDFQDIFFKTNSRRRSISFCEVLFHKSANRSRSCTNKQWDIFILFELYYSNKTCSKQFISE